MPNTSIRSKNDFTEYIMNRGEKYEDEIIKLLKKKTRIVKVAESYQAKIDAKFKNTINLMKQGESVLYQAVLHNKKDKTYGCPDLLIRSDKINEIFGYEVIDNIEAHKPSPKLKTPFHYLIVDIKWSTLHLNSDGRTLRNSNSTPAYKGQVLIYNQAIGNIQGYEPPEGYILGNKWKYTKNKVLYRGNNCMTKLGVIDFKGRDFIYYDKVKDALEWIRLVRTEGHNWELLPLPSRSELFPNMNNERDGCWRKIKRQLSEKIAEITSIWMCGPKERTYAHLKDIYSWKNHKCNSNTLGIKPGLKATAINQILKTNKTKHIKIIPKKISNNCNLQWRVAPLDTVDFYLDYETMNSNFGKITVSHDQVGYEDKAFIFLIGVGWEENNEWNFKSFHAESNTSRDELKMIRNFWTFVNKQVTKLGKIKSRFIHWTKAEPLSYKKLQLRHENIPDKNFMDLYDLFRKNPITINGALNFKLKSIAKAMKKNNMIHSSWDEENPCSNGLTAMLWAYQMYEKNCILNDEPAFKDIIHYNQIDCKVLWEIITYLRLNH